ncbi:MAG: ABC transporter substrate-binding protein [Lachnospiraceae bacterium]|nr:ABC transporter substrate-binding protein [Lachnospiraceae bacterium]
MRREISRRDFLRGSAASAATLAMSTVLGSAMTAAASEAVTIEFWHSMGGVNGTAMEYLVNKFNEENEYGITVNATYQGDYDDTINKLRSSQIGSFSADLVQIYDIGTNFMVNSGFIVPMQELIDTAGYDTSVLEENILAYYTVNDELYSMPFNSSTPLLYYNVGMFEAAGITEIPTSLEGIEAIAEQLLNEGGAQEVISLSIYGWFFEQFLCKMGLDYADNGNGRDGAATSVVFDSNGGAEKILTMWKQLYDEGYAPNVGTGGDAGLTDFVAGKSAITLGSTASLKQILEDVNGTFEVGTAYFPSISEEDEGGVSIGGGSLWALNNQDEVKQDAVWKFVEFLVSAESQAYWNAQTGYFPVTTEAVNEEVYQANMEEYPQFQTAIDQLHDSAPEYAGALLSVFSDARATVQSGIEDLLNGNRDVAGTVTYLADTINDSITYYNLTNDVE